ncbi:MAG: hypothetical protein AAFV53_26475 [Myxococcota bacterium]
MSFVVFSCRSCGAGIEVQPDNLLTICGHCGHIYPAQDIGDVPVHIVPSVDEATILQAVKDRMAADREMKHVSIQIERADGVYVPFYINRARVEGSWAGYLTKDKRRVNRSGSIDHTGDFPVLGRKHAHEFGLTMLGKVLFAHRPVPFADVTWTSVAMPVLSVELGEGQVDQVVRDDLIDRLGDAVKSDNGLTAITDFVVEPTIESRFLLLFPLWTVLYRVQGGSYRVAVSGGGAEILAAMEPTFFRRRLWGLVLGIGATYGVGALVFITFLVLPAIDGEDSAGALVALGGAIVVCMFFSWRTAKRLTESVNIEYLEG